MNLPIYLGRKSRAKRFNLGPEPFVYDIETEHRIEEVVVTVWIWVPRRRRWQLSADPFTFHNDQGRCRTCYFRPGLVGCRIVLLLGESLIIKKDGVDIHPPITARHHSLAA